MLAWLLHLASFLDKVYAYPDADQRPEAKYGPCVGIGIPRAVNILKHI